MINLPPTLTVAIRFAIASSVVCSLSMLPSFVFAQGELGPLDQDNGFKVELPSESTSEEPASEEPASQEPASEEPASQEPASEEPAIVITPGAPAASAVDKETTQGATVDKGATVGQAATVDKGATDTPDKAIESSQGDKSKEEAAAEYEKQKAAWLAGLKKLTFKELVKKIRDDERQIDQRYIRMPMIPKEQLVFERQIRALQYEVIVLNELLEPAAVEAFRSNPMESKAATDKVFEVLASKLKPRGRHSSYDPAGGLRLVNTILEIKGGDIGMDPDAAPTPEDEPFMQIIYQGYLASYGLQDFKSADEFLTRLENLNIGMKPEVRENFEQTLALWRDEEAIRAEEARADDLPRVKLETTGGDVVIELFENEAPNTVANFIKLVNQGYYDGLEFFHVVPSLYARSGCTANDGTTNPGYRIRNEYENGRRHFAGTVVMQNDGENTAGSQFIILHRPDPNLDGKVVCVRPCYGRVGQCL